MQVDPYSPLHGTTSTAADIPGIVPVCSRLFIACTAITVLLSDEVDGGA
jgi:hypothetical protein